MLDEIMNDLNNVLNKYDGQLWHVERKGCSYGDPYEDPYGSYSWVDKKVYIGNKEDVEKLLILKYISYKLEKFDITKHFNMEFINAKEDYEKEFVPKQSGDIVLYKNEKYRVTGFGDYIHLCSLKDGIDILVGRDENIQLIESKYWNENKK